MGVGKDVDLARRGSITNKASLSCFYLLKAMCKKMNLTLDTRISFVCPLSVLILDFGKCPNQKTHESESAGFLVQTGEDFGVTYK